MRVFRSSADESESSSRAVVARSVSSAREPDLADGLQASRRRGVEQLDLAEAGLGAVPRVGGHAPGCRAVLLQRLRRAAVAGQGISAGVDGRDPAIQRVVGVRRRQRAPRRGEGSVLGEGRPGQAAGPSRPSGRTARESAGRSGPSGCTAGRSEPAVRARTQKLTGSKTTNCAREGTLTATRMDNEHQHETPPFFIGHRHWSSRYAGRARVGRQIHLQAVALPDGHGRELVQKPVENAHRGLRHAAADALAVGVASTIGRARRRC